MKLSKLVHSVLGVSEWYVYLKEGIGYIPARIRIDHINLKDQLLVVSINDSSHSSLTVKDIFDIVMNYEENINDKNEIVEKNKWNNRSIIFSILESLFEDENDAISSGITVEEYYTLRLSAVGLGMLRIKGKVQSIVGFEVKNKVITMYYKSVGEKIYKLSSVEPVFEDVMSRAKEDHGRLYRAVSYVLDQLNIVIFEDEGLLESQLNNELNNSDDDTLLLANKEFKSFLKKIKI